MVLSLDILTSGTRARKEEVESCGVKTSPRAASCARRRQLGKLYQIAGDASGVVTGDDGFFEVVSHHRDHAESFDGIEIGDDLAGSLKCVLGLEFIGDGSAIDQSVVEDLSTGRVIERANVICGRKSQALVGLGHQVADVNLGCGRV